MKNQIHSAFDEIKAEQKLKTDTKYFLYELYNKDEAPEPKAKKGLILAPIAAVLAVVLSLGIFTTAVPVSAVSFDVENTSVELELNSLNKVLKVNCFGESEDFSELKLKNLDCKSAVSLIIEKSKSRNSDISSAVLTVNCKSAEKAERLADTITENDSTGLTVSCHSSHSKLRETAHSHGISTGKYQVFLNLKEYEPELTAEQANSMTMKELRDRLSHYCSKDSSDTSEETETTTCNETHHNGQIGNGHHGDRQH